MSAELVLRHANQVEKMAGSGAIFALDIGSCEPHQRRLLLDHHSKVVGELRRRGHNVRSNVVVDENGIEHVTIRVVNQPSWSLPEDF